MPRRAARPLRKTPSTVVLLAGYDLMLAALILIAGSQGIYRFAPPLLLWVAIYAMIGLKLATNLRPLLMVLRDNAAILAYPAMAFISAIWSVEPGHSSYSALQLTVTYLAGFWIGWRYRPSAIALVIVLSLSPLIVLSLVNWATGMFGLVYSDAGGLLGIFGNKNTLGRMSLLLGLAALALLFGRQPRLPQRALLLCVLVMAAFALLLSKSATSAIIMFGATGLLVALTMHGYRAGIQLAIAVAGILAFLGGCALLAFGNVDPAGGVLDLFGKSSNLTGRTSLWTIAFDQIGAHPWLGVGFDAYWDSGAFLAADAIQLRFGDGLISFHNFILDIWVGTGVPGLIGMAVTLGTIVFSYLRYFLASRNVDAAMMLAFFVAAIGVALFNPLLYAQHENMIVILIAFAVSARISLSAR
jgi:exopolysaccharide production protein ExoQ